MNSLDTDRERLDALLCDLKARALRPGQVPYQGMQELGQFVEEVHTALGGCLDFDPTKIHIDTWHKQMERHDYECHAAQYAALNVIYGSRNISSHPNEEKHGITYAQVKRRYDDVRELLPDLASRLTRHDFVTALFRVQRCSRQQHRASALCVAIADTGSLQDYLPIVLEYAVPFISEAKRGFLKAPEDRQLALVLTQLGRLCSVDDDDVLGGLVHYLLRQSSTRLRLEPLRAWLGRYGTMTTPGVSVPRLRNIRLTLDRDPRISSGLLLRAVTVVEPVVPQLTDHLPELPIPVADMNHLYAQIVALLNGIRVAFAGTADHSRDAVEAYHWQEFVLEIEVPGELAALEFEFAAGRLGGNLTSLFRCVTLRPFLECDTLQPLRGLDRPIAHPRLQGNAVAVWATSKPKELFDAAQGKDCLFTGPAAWSVGSGMPPIVDAFEGFPGAVVCQTDDEIEGLGPIYDSKEQMDWPELLDRVTVLRRKGARLKVLWNDPSYDTVLADSV